MSFSIPSQLSDQQLVDQAKNFLKLPIRQQKIFLLCVEQEKEYACEEAYGNIKTIHHIIKQPKKENHFFYLSIHEKIPYICHKAGIGSVQMSAFSKYSDRHIRRLLTMAYEKVAEHAVG